MKHRHSKGHHKESAGEFRMEDPTDQPNHPNDDADAASSRHKHRHHRKSRSKTEEYEINSQTIAVIGGGVAGLAVAARLAARGYKVDLLEAASEPGGKMRDYQADGFRFDGGPSLFTLPEVMEQLFTDCGKRMADYVSYDRLELVTRYFYPDGTQINAWSTPKGSRLSWNKQ